MSKLKLKRTQKHHNANDVLNMLFEMSEHFVSHPEYENIEEWKRQMYQQIFNHLSLDLAKQI
jgi:hypothetical protein